MVRCHDNDPRARAREEARLLRGPAPDRCAGRHPDVLGRLRPGHRAQRRRFRQLGWRIPFLLAFPLLAIAMYVRQKVEESPEFLAMVAEAEAEAADGDRPEKKSFPLLVVLRENGAELLAGTLASFLGIGLFYVVTTFMISYAKNQLGMAASTVLAASLTAAAIQIGWLLLLSRVADRISAARLTMIGGVATVALALPLMGVASMATYFGLVVGIFIGLACLSLAYAVNGKLLLELFSAETRYTAMGLCYNLSAVLSGFIPMIASALLLWSDGAGWSVSLLVVVIGVLGGLGGYLTQTIHRRRLRETAVDLPEPPVATARDRGVTEPV
ncbi:MULTISPECIES: MFS transporter [Gordonia]|uniref:MFS transporter n=1 Tax=Gordonia TaxID=2053 RepID=UPI003262FE33